MNKKSVFHIICVFSMIFILGSLFPLSGVMAAKKQYLKIGTLISPSDMNVFNSTGQIEMECMSYIYEPLCLQTMDGKLEPQLAKSWEYDEDTLSWIFHLDERAKWNDGKPVTAEDVKFSFDTQYKFNFAAGGKTKKFVKSVDIIDKHTVSFRLKEPIGSFVGNASAVFIIPKHVWLNVEDPGKITDINTLGSGPFILKEFKSGRYVHFDANKDYWRTPVSIDGVILYIYGTTEATVLALQKGEIDVVAAFKGLEPLIPKLEKDKNITIFKEETSNTRFIFMVNHRTPPNNVREFRQALSMAIDRKPILEHSYKGYAVMPYMGSIAPGVTEWINPKVAWPGTHMDDEKRIAEANAMLDKLNYKRGDDGIRVTPSGRRLDFKLSSLGSPNYVRTAEIITESMKKIGIKVTTRTGDVSSVLGALYSGKQSDSWEWSMIGYPKPADPDWMTTEYGADPPNAWYDSSAIGWNDNPESKELKELLRKARRETDAKKRWNMIQQAQELFARDLPVIVLTHHIPVGAYRTDKFEGWKPLGVTYTEVVTALHTVKTIFSLKPKK